jgi:benzaldehyde dehydrogenase (NAD)
MMSEAKTLQSQWIVDVGGHDVIEPATGRRILSLKHGDRGAVAAACADAAAAQQDWFARPYEERANALRKAADIMESDSVFYIDWLVREAGSIQPKAAFELAVVVKALREASSMPSQPQGLILPSTEGRLSYCRRVPLGVVGVISPFNFPAYLAMRAVVPALALGNAVVLKPDPRTSISGGLLLEQLLMSAGVPEKVFQVVPGGGEAGEALCTDPNVAMIQFTGSTAVGKKIGALAGGELKKLSLELGGKNSLIVLEDADLDLAASNAAWGAYLHQGQICMAAGRILVHESVHDALADKLAEKARCLPVGDPAAGQAAIGPLISAGQVERASNLVQGAVAAGAKLRAGGKANGLFFEPTVLTGVSSAMPVFHDEFFAPIAALTPFKDDAEAIELANGTEYGLSAAIISRSVGRAMAIGFKLCVGLLHINDQTVGDEVVNPFGGRGKSGNGTSIGGPANWDEFSQWQWVTIQEEAPRYPF